MSPFLIGALVLAAVALVIAVWAWKSRGSPAPVTPPASDVSRRLESACREALATVDLIAPAGTGESDLPPATLASVGERLRFISEQLSGIDGASIPGQVEDAVDELRHVSISLSAALDADRSLQLGNVPPKPDGPAASRARIAARTAELDVAARTVIAVTGTQD